MSNRQKRTGLNVQSKANNKKKNVMNEAKPEATMQKRGRI